MNTGWLTRLFTGSKKGVIADIFDGIDKVVTSDEERLTLKKEAIKLYVEDLSSARKMYEDDSSLQKIFAITFLVFYLLLTMALMYIVYRLAQHEVTLETWAITLLSTIWGGMSAKVNTITDFLFGSSKEKFQLSNDTKKKKDES